MTKTLFVITISFINLSVAIGQKSNFTVFMSLFVSMDKSSIHEKMISYGYELQATTSNTPAEGYNQLLFSKKSTIIPNNKKTFYYADNDFYFFNFKDGNDDFPVLISFVSSDASLVTKLKQSFKTTYPNQKLEVIKKDDCFWEEGKVEINSKTYIIQFTDCNYTNTPEGQAKTIKNYSITLIVY